MIGSVNRLESRLKPDFIFNFRNPTINGGVMLKYSMSTAGLPASPADTKVPLRGRFEAGRALLPWTVSAMPPGKD